MTAFQNQARIVIIGGGVIGTSIAYHLAELNINDVVLVERGDLTCGTTWHAAGLVPQLRKSNVMTQLSKYAADLYSRLGDLTSQPTGFRRNGFVHVATNEDRLLDLRRMASIGKNFDVEVEICSPDRLKKLWPLLNIDDVIGGVYVPQDGQTNPVDTTMALAAGARKAGIRFLTGTTVVGIDVQNGRVAAVRTDKGNISCDVVVNCAGVWSRHVGHMAGVEVPVYAAEHMYVTTEEILGLPSDLPILRDPDSYIYVKEEAGKLLIGSFEPVAKPLPISTLPANSQFLELPEDWDHFELPMRGALHRIPVLENCGIRHFMNGPESFTPDNRYILGEAPEVANFFVATGFNSQGILCGAGAGKAMAEWISEGAPTMDLSEVDIQRFSPFQSNRRYLQHRTVESMGLLYKNPYPFKQVETARPARQSPLHHALERRGAVFGELCGWERANWFATAGHAPHYELGYKRTGWHDCWEAEHRAAREAVAIFDLSGFAKFRITGRDALAVLERICANRIDVPAGRTVYTAILNSRGGIESDLTVTRLDPTDFLVVSAAGSQQKDFHWIRRAIKPEEHAWITDITSAYSVLSVMGPQARALLERVSPADFSNEAFPFATMQTVDIGYARAWAVRLTFVGELGWEIYVPTEFAVPLYETLMIEGADLGVRPAGFHALDSLRCEKGYRHWGDDITPGDTPYEAGLGFAVALDKETPFTGQEALRRQKVEGVRRHLMHFRLTAGEQLLYGGEPIIFAGQCVGYLTSVSYGFTVGAAVGMGYVNRSLPEIREMLAREDGFGLEIAATLFAAEASLRPYYDPLGVRTKL
ncbi:MAG: GcvT family protein [Anaerolineales bacterium]|nr:GcvT family protein [Anaerolineales bacterium]